MQVRVAGRGKLMSIIFARPQTIAMMSEAIKTHGFRNIGLVDDDRVYRHHEMGIFGKHNAIRENQRFTDTAFEADFSGSERAEEVKL